MSKEAPPVPACKRNRDIRVDRIGFVNELVSEYIGGDDGVKAKLKATLAPGDEAFADFFESKLVAATDSSVSVSALMKLYECRAISRAQFVDCLTASASKVTKLGLPLKVVKRLVKSFPGTPRLIVNRIKGMEFDLADAITALHGAIAGDTARAAVVADLARAA